MEVTVNGTTTVYNKTTDYGYDLLNRLTTLSISTPYVTVQGSVDYTNQSTANSYNAAGQRIKKVENNETTKYFYSGSATLFTTNQNNFLLTENILDISGKAIASLRFSDQNPNTPDPYAGKYFFYNYDQRGSTTAILQPDGSMVKGYEYDAFGALTQNGAADFLNEATFTGSVSDLSSGLQYMNSRFYNPSTGRFLSQDSYSGNAYDPWTQHLYSYCGNNPTNMIDPTGHRAVDIYEYPDIITQIGDAIRQIGDAIKAQADKFNQLQEFAMSNGPAIVIAGVVAVGVLGICIAEGVSTYSQTLTADRVFPYVNDDAKAKEKAVPIPQFRSNTDIHHIVAQGSMDAFNLDSKRILKNAGIDINSELNLIDVPRNYHQRMHTKGPLGYYSYVNYQLIDSIKDLGSTYKDEDYRKCVNDRLNFIKVQIAARASANIHWPGIMDMPYLFD